MLCVKTVIFAGSKAWFCRPYTALILIKNTRLTIVLQIRTEHFDTYRSPFNVVVYRSYETMTFTTPSSISDFNRISVYMLD